MALAADDLSAALLRIKPMNDPLAAAQRFAQAYALYAAKATDAAGNALVVYNQPLFEATLAAQFIVTNGTPLAAAQAFAAAFVAFWTGATFAALLPAQGLSIGGTGIMSLSAASTVTLAQGALLQGELAALFATTQSDTPQRIHDVAQALHTATLRDVTVTITGIDTTPPPAGPLPCAQIGLLR